MKKVFALLVISYSLSLTPAFCQNVAMNTTGTAADVSALLDLNTGNTFTSPGGKGLIVPNVMLSSFTDATTIPSPAASLLVYVPSGSGLTPSGYYYNWGSSTSPQWLQLGSGSGSTNCKSTTWLLKGNSGIDPNSNWLGTNDGVAFQIKVNGQKAGWIDYASPYNTSFGWNAALNANTTGSGNLAIGYQALSSNTSGSNNVALGYQALNKNTTDSNNIAIGFQALYNCTSSPKQHNIAIGGISTMLANTTGTDNIALGSYALTQNTSGSFNVALGAGGNALGGNTTGNRNTAVGTLTQNSTGNSVTGIGSSALTANTTGSRNTASGASALGYTTTGIGNTATGFEAGYFNFNAGNSFGVDLGDSAGYRNNAINNDYVGYQSGITGGAFGNTTGNTIYLGNSSTIAIMANANMNIVTWSDRRVKDSIKENVPGLDFITRLRPVTFHYNIHRENKLLGIKDEGNYPGKYDIEKITQSGFIAQEVDSAAQACGCTFSGIVKPKTPGGLYALGYTTFVVPLVKAIQELTLKNQSLHTKVNKYEADINALKKMVEFSN